MQKLAALLSAFALVSLTGCASGQAGRAGVTQSLPEARRGFVTTLRVKNKSLDAVPQPPAGFQLLRYPAPLGDFPAYLAAAPPGSGRHPALIWLAGGFSNSIGDTPWAPATPDNDQSARAFPNAGVMTLYPSLRGGNGNPGFLEGLYGEVDDVLAAARYLATRPDVDPRRIYLGGHSTGGTLALLVAESTHTFRAVFAFGPVKAMGEYGTDNLPFDYDNKQELLLRAPLLYLGSIQSPTFVFEGTDPPGNLESLRRMRALCSNPQVHFYESVGLDHFSELAPVTPLVAAEIARDTKAVPHFSFLTASPKIVPSTQVAMPDR